MPDPDPFNHISQESLFNFLEELTAIGADSGWRLSTTGGETEARAWVRARLAEMTYLGRLGMTVSEEPFRTYLGVELHQTRVFVTIGGVETEIPADGMPGHRENLPVALRYDSDGQLNDSEADPVTISSAPLVLRTEDDVDELTPAVASGRVVLIDFAVIDRSVLGAATAVPRADTLLQNRPAAVVTVSRFSNTIGVSHGAFAGDVSVFSWVTVENQPPVLNIRIEDLAPLGINSYNDLNRIDSVRVVWDVDTFSPGDSANLFAHIPGADSTRAMILGAHLDSPNTPGALDDGSGSVTLLEVARVLDASRTQPPVDLYLCWFNSHERGLYGSTNWVPRHQEVLDRALAMLQVDCLSRPLNGYFASLYLEGWSYGIFGDNALPWPDYLVRAVGRRGVAASSLDYWGIVSDNSSFNSYDVPNANLIFMDLAMNEVHYDGHLHDPYDDAELARDEADTLEDMALIALTAATRTGWVDPALRVTPQPVARAVFVASHTEAAHMLPTCLTELSMALAWEGLDVDVVPYGQQLTAADLDDAAMVVVLPVHDYPSPDGDVTLYDEAWAAAELDLLRSYASGGGLLVITNSANRMKYNNITYEANEDWSDMNSLTDDFGVHFSGAGMPAETATVSGSHPLVQGVSELSQVSSNGVGFTVTGGQILARNSGVPVVAILDAGSGELVVIADLAILGSDGSQANLPFWRNLGEYALSR